jgi:hypothetical protein
MRIESEPTDNTKKVNPKEKYLRIGFRFGIKVKIICERALLEECNAQI